MQSCNPDIFKGAMRQLAATVTLVTACDEQGCHGMPATAVTSLSADPPSLLVCINQTASMHGPTVRSGYFCVNMLADHQSDLCNDFGARPSKERFAVGNWQSGLRGLPFLPDAAASLFCIVEREMPYGTHTIFIGRILEALVNRERSPLVFAAGRMNHLANVGAPSSPEKL